MNSNAVRSRTLEGVVPLPGSAGAADFASAESLDHRDLVHSRIGGSTYSRRRIAGSAIVVTSSEIANGKPHPEPYLKGAAVLGVEAADCVVMEDVPAGIRSGKTAGARVIAVRTTASDSELRAAGADWIVDDCESITAVDDPALGALRITLA